MLITNATIGPILAILATAGILVLVALPKIFDDQDIEAGGTGVKVACGLMIGMPIIATGLAFMLPSVMERRDATRQIVAVAKMRLLEEQVDVATFLKSCMKTKRRSDDLTARCDAAGEIWATLDDENLLQSTETPAEELAMLTTIVPKEWSPPSPSSIENKMSSGKSDSNVR